VPDGTKLKIEKPEVPEKQGAAADKKDAADDKDKKDEKPGAKPPAADKDKE
jgi:hypothetical protein